MREYHEKDYNCLHFAVDYYKELTDKDISVHVAGMMTSRDKRVIDPEKLKQFTRLDEPKTPCIAIMRQTEPHAGVYRDGLIYHFNEQGLQAQAEHVVSLQYGKVSYYEL